MAIFKNTPPIVTNGLVLALDAANPKSYTSGSTTWGDISGNNNSGSLVNGPTFSSENGGTIVFDGVSNYVSGSITPISGSAFTVAAWVKPLVAPSTKTYFSIGSAQGTDLTIHFRLLTDTVLRFGLYSDDLDGTIPSVTGKWNYLVGTLTLAKTQTIYHNGNFISTRTSAGLFSGNATFAVGGWGIIPVSQFINANIAQVQVYNRALSQQEILQNYNAIKGRFGL